MVKQRNKAGILRPQLLLLTIGIALAAWGVRGSELTRAQATYSASHPKEVLGVTQLVPLQTLPLHSITKPDCAAKACIAMTFDDGPDPVNTPKILDILEREHVHATFFVIGSKVANNTAILQRIQKYGNEIGNHSWSHTDFTKLNPIEMLDQINKTQEALVAAGVGPAKYFRLPYGDRNRLVKQTLTLPSILWNVDPKDWTEQDPKHLAEVMQQQAKPGAIVVMHDTHPVTAAALEQIIHNLKAAKLQPVTLSDLLTLPPETHGGEFIDRE